VQLREEVGQVEQLGRSAADELADRLAASVINGEFEPGERLVEADLASRYNLSRGPVRTALSTLHRLGLVEMRPKRGMVVVTLTTTEVRDLYEVRIALERAVVERLSTSSDVDWSTLRRLAEEVEEATRGGSTSESTKTSLDFHRELCALAGNERLLRAWEAHSALIRLAIRMRQSADNPVAPDPRTNEHRELVDLLAAGDSDRAVALIVSHLQKIRDDLVGILESQDAASTTPAG
jgi:GntR family transcriptional regulator of gluconate operon